LGARKSTSLKLKLKHHACRERFTTTSI